MKPWNRKYLVLINTAMVSVALMSYITGPAGNGFNVTGAPFDNGTCNNCHYGGTYNATVGMQLLSGGSPAANYVPGMPYVLRVSRSAIGLPPGGGFGFQLTCATFPGNVDVDAWGTSLPFNTIKRIVAGRHYIEHTEKIDQSHSYIDIPWTGPNLVGSASVKFYIALNTVDGEPAPTPSNDEVLTATLLVNISPLSTNSLVYFNGNSQPDNSVQLNWATQSEGTISFDIEKSQDGIQFLTIGKIRAKEAQNYQYRFIDTKPFPVGFYRIKQTDNVEVRYSSIVTVAAEKELEMFCFIKEEEIILLMQNERPEKAVVNLISIDGRNLVAKHVLLSEGINRFAFPKPVQAGMYLIRLKNEKGIDLSKKIWVD